MRGGSYRKWLTTALSGLILGGFCTPSRAADCVVLLHGLARTASSMTRLAEALTDAGYIVSNPGYPSREHTIEVLAPRAVREGIDGCRAHDRVHFVTHSLGGILVRYYLEHDDIPNLGRVVMLAPPNQGSEVVDRLRDVPGFELWNGPAGVQLGTDAQSVPSRLGPVTFDLGVIAGNRTFNVILSQFLPNPDDGKVSVERTKVEGMHDFVVVPHSHPFIMRAPDVIEETLSFLATGAFRRHTSG